MLIGLAVDYAIQFQARFDEQRVAQDAATAPRGRRPRRAAAAGGPTIVTAGLATAVGFLVLLLSPGADGPRLRRRCWCWASSLALALRRHRGLRGAGALATRAAAPGRPAALPRAARRLCARPASHLAAGGAAPRDARLARPRRAGAGLLDGQAAQGAGASALVVAVVGLALDTQSEVISDVQQLVPQDLQALRDVNELQKETGIAGEIDVTVRADDITDPRCSAG